MDSKKNESCDLSEVVLNENTDSDTQVRNINYKFNKILFLLKYKLILVS